MLLMMISLLDDEQRDLIEKIFKEDRRLFFNIARKILGSTTEAEDVVSDAMIHIVENIERIKDLPRHEMQAYCIVVVRNCSNERFRKNRQEVSLNEIEVDVADVGNEPGANLVRQEQIDEITRLVQKLSREDGALLRLRYYHESNYATIAAILGITEETARKRAERIRKTIRAQIEGNHYE